jgi:hypothetical protein
MDLVSVTQRDTAVTRHALSRHPSVTRVTHPFRGVTSVTVPTSRRRVSA